MCEADRFAAAWRRAIAARLLCAVCVTMLVAGCQPDGSGGAAIPDPESTEPYAGIGVGETVRLVGTEPFWGGQVEGRSLTYTTPEDPDGTAITVERFAGRGGVSFSGSLDGAALEMTVTALACSDGMSDRSYPFTVTLRIGDEMRDGCGWSERQPFEGPTHP